MRRRKSVCTWATAVSPIQHLQLDAFRRMEPNDYWDAWHEQDPTLVALKHAALCRAMHAALSEYARHGVDVIFDTVLWHREDWRYLLEDLDGLPVYLVGVTCGLEELVRREQARGDREIGLATGQFKTIHTGKVYDFQCFRGRAGQLRNRFDAGLRPSTNFLPNCTNSLCTLKPRASSERRDRQLTPPQTRYHHMLIQRLTPLLLLIPMAFAAAGENALSRVEQSCLKYPTPEARANCESK